MDVKRLPWVAGMMHDLGLEDRGGGFWTSDDGRSIYLGQGSAVITTEVDGAPDFTTGHRYPVFPDERWLFDAIDEHQQEITWRAHGLDQKFN